MEKDTLYYIKDYSGNYYKTNRVDQLVVASNEQDATLFNFVQANSRIGAGRKSAFYLSVISHRKLSNGTFK